MKSFKSLLAILLSFVMTIFGLITLFYYIQNEISILSFIVGLLGFVIIFLPAYESWKNFFTNILK
jgi:hypothetical protein